MRSVIPSEKMFELLPTIVRKLDAEQGNPLRGVMRIVGEQAVGIEENIRQLHEDAFIETCHAWAVPYHGELMGITPAVSSTVGAEDADRAAARQALIAPREQVANAAHHYRRKGAYSVLEQLADSAAAWPSKAVEFQDVVLATESLSEAIVPPTTVDFRRSDSFDHLDTPFDEIGHTIDVRRMKPPNTGGRIHTRNVGLYVWRIPSRPMTSVAASCARSCGSGDESFWVYTFDPIGVKHQLFVNPDPNRSDSESVEQVNLPAPLLLHMLQDEQDPTQASPQYYGVGRSLAIWIDDAPGTQRDNLVPRQLVRPTDLSDVAGIVCQSKPECTDDVRKRVLALFGDQPGRVLVDPVNGVLAMRSNSNRVRSSYYYGFSADIGGGEYDRPPRYRDLTGVHRFRTPINQSDGLAKVMKEAFCADAQIVEPKEKKSDSPRFRIHASLSTRTLHGAAPKCAEIKLTLKAAAGGDAKTVQTKSNAKGDWLAADLQGFEIHKGATVNAQIAVNGHTSEAEWYCDVSDCLTPRNEHTLIELSDSNAHRSSAKRIVLNVGQSLAFQAVNRRRPSMTTIAENCAAGLRFSLAPGSRLEIEGVRFAGGHLRIEYWRGEKGAPEGDCGCESDTPAADAGPPTFAIRHSTIGVKSCKCAGGSLQLHLPGSLIHIASSIVGPMTFGTELVAHDPTPYGPTRLAISDSIVDAGQGVAIDGSDQFELRVFRSTLRGRLKVRGIDHGQDSIFISEVAVDRPQSGGMRFCYIPPGSVTPPQYYCQPSLATARRSSQSDCKVPDDGPCGGKNAADDDRDAAPVNIAPSFASLQPEDAAYMRLAPDCPQEIRRGAEDESEMGVFHDLYEPQREANLRARLRQFTPASMRSEILFAEQ